MDNERKLELLEVEADEMVSQLENIIDLYPDDRKRIKAFEDRVDKKKREVNRLRRAIYAEIESRKE